MTEDLVLSGFYCKTRPASIKLIFRLYSDVSTAGFKDELISTWSEQRTSYHVIIVNKKVISTELCV